MCNRSSRCIRRCGFFNAAVDHAHGGEVHPRERAGYRRRMRPFDLLGDPKLFNDIVLNFIGRQRKRNR
jgi:hypothetical protein